MKIKVHGNEKEGNKVEKEKIYCEEREVAATKRIMLVKPRKR
jgi:hypothetical protein